VVFAKNVKDSMTICHIIIQNITKSVVFIKLTKGFEMSILLKNAESLFEKFEKVVEEIAERVF
jgi:hypothetical protein